MQGAIAECVPLAELDLTERKTVRPAYPTIFEIARSPARRVETKKIPQLEINYFSLLTA
jgi:hypothetical protein